MARPPRTTLPDGIGKESDRVVALREGLTADAVRKMRQKAQIPSAHGWGGDRRSKDWREKY